jgi:hypothetical protein
MEGKVPKKVVWLILAALMLWAPAMAQAGPSEVLTAKWWPSANAFARGGTYPMILMLTIKPNMHINSNQPDDPDLIPTKIKFSAAKGLSLSAAGFPQAKKKKLGFTDKPIAVFDGTVLVRTSLTVAKDAKLGEQRLIAKLSFQGCDDNMCFMPENHEVPLEVKIIPAGQKGLPLNRDLFAR